jgi:hypothetical protein
MPVTNPRRTLALVIASRGNSQTLQATIAETLKGVVLESTKVVVGLDEDDASLQSALNSLASFPEKAHVKAVLGPRPDAIGDVYNRCVAQEPADIYVNGADDVIIRTAGWDAAIVDATAKVPDFIGVVGFGKMPVASALPVMCAVTRPLIDRMGYFLQPFTPYWWMDTWLFEITHLIGRMIPVDLDVECLEWKKTRGMRELTYWATFYDDMRPHRRAIAEAIIKDPEFMTTDAFKQELLGRMDRLCDAFKQGNSALRDPAYAANIMRDFAHDAPADERYLRVKARSMELVRSVRP